MKNPKYDIVLVILASIIAFFISVAASAFYDFFKTIAIELPGFNVKFFQIIFTLGPLACAAYLLRNLLKGL